MKPSIEQLLRFLMDVDDQFPIAISKKQNLDSLAAKLHSKATLCTAIDGDEIVSMAAGYTDHVVENMAYLSILATRKEYKGKGLAEQLVNEFISIARDKHLIAVHLYAVHENLPAVKLYEKLGFVPYTMENEPRPRDLHLIYHLGH